MTHNDFNHLLSSIKALSPEQMRQLRRQIDSELSHDDPRTGRQSKKSPAQASGKEAKRAKAAPQKPKTPFTIAELHQRLLAEGRISRLPDTAADYDDPDDQQVSIEGEPLSETILRERR
jgi:hypothetical protein